jgi:hypothetical protein
MNITKLLELGEYQNDKCIDIDERNYIREEGRIYQNFMNLRLELIRKISLEEFRQNKKMKFCRFNDEGEKLRKEEEPNHTDPEIYECIFGDILGYCYYDYKYKKFIIWDVNGFHLKDYKWYNNVIKLKMSGDYSVMRRAED